MWSSTRSEVICAFRAAKRSRRREHEVAVFVAWRTATLTRARKIPALSRLLRSRRRRSEAEQAEIRADVARMEAEFNRLETEARERGGASGT